VLFVAALFAATIAAVSGAEYANAAPPTCVNPWPTGVTECMASNTAQLVAGTTAPPANVKIDLAGGVTYTPAAAMVVSVAGLTIQGPTSGLSAIISGGSVSQVSSDGDIFDVSATGSLTLSDVSLRNTVTGAIAAIDTVGSLDLESSDVQGNQVSPIFADGGNVVIRNSTIADNSFASSVAGVNDAGDVKLFNDTIAYNDFGMANTTGTAELTNTMIVKNTHGDCTAHVTTADASWDSAGTCGGGTVAGITAQPSPGITASPGVGANGGSTETIALLAGSPAIGAGDFTGTNCPATDQRGVARTGHCDIGAYQFVAASLSASPATVAAGAAVTVNWAGIGSPTAGDWIGFYNTAQPTVLLNWEYDNNCTQTAGTTAAGTGSCGFTAPSGTGTYDYVLYANNSFTVLLTSNTVSVTGTTLTATPASTPGVSTETVSWSGVASPSSGDWVAVYQSGQSGGSFLDWFYAGSCGYTIGAAEAASGSCPYVLPSTTGTYYFELISAGTGPFNVLAESNNVTVTAVGASLSAAPTSVAGGGSVTVSWSGVASPSATDWIGVYVAGQSGGSFVNWFYAGSCGYTSGASDGASGSCSTTMPLTAGSYDFILYTAGSFHALVMSNTVTVT
jgi:hypothetical protein